MKIEKEKEKIENEKEINFYKEEKNNLFKKCESLENETKKQIEKYSHLHQRIQNLDKENYENETKKNENELIYIEKIKQLEEQIEIERKKYEFQIKNMTEEIEVNKKICFFINFFFSKM